MLLIIGTKEEHAVQNVLTWLSYYGIETMVIGHNELEKIISSVSVTENKEEIIFSYEGKTIPSSQISKVWFRKSAIDESVDLNEIKDKENLHERLSWHVSRELHGFKRGIYEHLLHTKECLGDPEKNDISKVYSLLKAKMAGLEVPDTLITSKRSEAETFVEDHSGSITKPLQDSLMAWEGNRAFTLYTNKVMPSELQEYGEQIFPSMFQSEIKKEYEVRTFFLSGKCYSMAIFSQEDRQTEVDFRDYNWKQMNRMVPYQLPAEVESKIQKFMDLVGLTTGSIDLIKTHDHRYVFLEVNPVGQFGFVSSCCNYYLEDEIANHLN
jgi:ATP-GRASP peptide maturase of grasp-with-spasm system